MGEDLERHPVVAIASGLGIFYGCMMLAVVVGFPLAGLGARIADPDARHDFGILAREPYVTRTGEIKDKRPFQSPVAQRRLEAESTQRRGEWEREKAETREKKEAESALYRRVADEVISVLGAEQARAYGRSLVALGDRVEEEPPLAGRGNSTRKRRPRCEGLARRQRNADSFWRS